MTLEGIKKWRRNSLNRRILIISFLFHDTEAIGSIRIRGLLRYLPEFGWDPIVLTSKSKKNDEIIKDVIDTPFEDSLIKWKKNLGLSLDETIKEQFRISTRKNKKDYFDLILKLWNEIFSYPDGYASWRKIGVEYGKKLLNEGGIDAILTSSDPVTCHMIGSDLKKYSNCVWIADFRDLWSQNQYYGYSNIRRIIDRRLEKDILSKADALTTVSIPLTKELKKMHPEKNIECIMNGFDPEQMNHESVASDRFSIVHTGYLYLGKRDPEMFLKSIEELIGEGVIDSNDLSIDFYGYDEGWLRNEIEKFSFQKQIGIHGKVSRDEAIQRQRRAQILLLITWNDKKDRGVYTGKLFDYLAAKRPILSIGARGSVIEDLLNDTQAGAHVTSLEEIKKKIVEFYYEFKTNGHIGYRSNLEEIAKYDQRKMAMKFAKLLDNITPDDSS